MFLNHLIVENFKSLYKVELNPRRVTILIGPNAGGKSSILQLLALVKQSTGPSSGGYFKPSGDIIELGSFSDIVFNHDESRTIRVVTEGRIILEDEADRIFGAAIANFSYRFDVRKDLIESVYCKLNQGSLEVEMEVIRNNLRIGKFTTQKGSGKLRLANPMNLTPGMQVSEAPGNTATESDFINKLFQNSDLIKNLFKNYYYIPPSRMMDEFGLPLIPSLSSEFVTAKGQRNTLSQLVSYLSSSNPEIKKMISTWTKRIFGKEVTTRNVFGFDSTKQSTNVTIELLDEAGRYNSIVNDGSGTNQVILLLTLLGITPPKSILGIDEPEIHLHPKAQAELGKILIEASLSEDKQILFTTHSEHMLYPFLTSVASKNENSLSKEDLCILYFETDAKTKVTKIVSLEVDERGMISGGLKGFFEAEINSINEYLKALET